MQKECYRFLQILHHYLALMNSRIQQKIIIINMVAARLVIEKNWYVKYMFQLSERNNEIWELLINDKLTCDIRFQNGLFKVRRQFYKLCGILMSLNKDTNLKFKYYYVTHHIHCFIYLCFFLLADCTFQRRRSF